MIMQVWYDENKFRNHFVCPYFLKVVLKTSLI